mmetsp:Transcript_6541/g.15335  ORF Transcript_6541/g.15335 Transcript_6541/m.15335 type:complete len:248 (-) Transcript_6541:141-884(-)
MWQRLHNRVPQFCPGEWLHPLRDCCCGMVDIEVGYRFMCLAFLAWGLVGFISACVSAGSSEGVWMDTVFFNSRGLSWLRMFSFLHLIVLQGYGLRAHAKRDTEKSNIYFWGWVVYSTYSFVIELHRLASVDADAAAYENQRCDACMLKFPETASCEDPKVVECVGFAASEHKPSAYMYGVASLLAGLALNGYFCLVARSYWFYLHDDRLAVLGQSVNEELTPLEQEALGGDTNVYVRMEGGGESCAS